MAIINPKAGTMVNATTVHVQLWEVHPSILYAFGVARDVCICCLMDKLLSVGFKRLIIMYIVIVYRTVTHTLKLKGLGCVDVVARFNGRAQFRKEKPRQAGFLLFGFASRKRRP